MYSSAYVEGINNLYEFDVGSLSGWMYNVNGWYPNYGCSRYQVKDGDVVEWCYTCDLGEDLGSGMGGSWRHQDIESADIGSGVPGTHWPLEIFERPPNHATRQHNKTDKKPRMALCGHPWLFVRFSLCGYQFHCRAPPFSPFEKSLGVLMKRR